MNPYPEALFKPPQPDMRIMAIRTPKPLLWFVIALASMSCEAQSQDLPRITLNAGIHNINAEVAQSPQERATGLMLRQSMPANQGMLFVFEQAEQQCFWMKNTLIPLDIAFVADDGTIINIEHMKPLSLDNHCSTKPVRMALEMNEGWFARKGVSAGSKLSGKPFTH
jgi:uncharacterized membrane protein (UPF0127 family)